MNKFGGIILAGGKSSRMGQDKGLMLLNGKPMVQHSIDVMTAAGIGDIIIVSNAQESYQQFAYQVVADEIKDKGPLAGIYSGLLESDQRSNFVLSCDTPFVDPLVLTTLMSEYVDDRIAIARHHGRVHPLIGIYSTDLITAAQASLDRNELKMEVFIAENNGRLIDLDYLNGRISENCFANLNTLEDLNRYGS